MQVIDGNPILSVYFYKSTFSQKYTWSGELLRRINFLKSAAGATKSTQTLSSLYWMLKY